MGKFIKNVISISITIICVFTIWGMITKMENLENMNLSLSKNSKKYLDDSLLCHLDEFMKVNIYKPELVAVLMKNKILKMPIHLLTNFGNKQNEDEFKKVLALEIKKRFKVIDKNNIGEIKQTNERDSIRMIFSFFSEDHHMLALSNNNLCNQIDLEYSQDWYKVLSEENSEILTGDVFIIDSELKIGTVMQQISPCLDSMQLVTFKDSLGKKHVINRFLNFKELGKN